MSELFYEQHKYEQRKNKTLLITGGTGSLGNEIVKQLRDSYRALPWEKIIIYSRDERKQEDMAAKFGHHPIFRFFIGDIRDKDRLELACNGVTHIIHAAALKVVPSIEFNPIEAIKTNIYGTQNLVEVVAKSNTIQKVLGISTDKAVFPINLYGTTKLALEKLLISASKYCPASKISVCRYGNVTESRGSVIPLFKKQLEDGKVLTVTNDRMTRFYITIEDAAKFVIARLDDMQGEEIFIPEMKSYRVTDLALVMLENYGRTDGYEIVGKRPGEKIHEDLIAEHEFEYTFDLGDYYKITKTLNKENEKYIREAREAGLRADRSYNSSQFLMSKDELEKQLLKDRILSTFPFSNIIPFKEDEPQGHA